MSTYASILAGALGLVITFKGPLNNIVGTNKCGKSGPPAAILPHVLSDSAACLHPSYWSG